MGFMVTDAQRQEAMMDGVLELREFEGILAALQAGTVAGGSWLEERAVARGLWLAGGR